MPVSVFRKWKEYAPFKCDHDGTIWYILVKSFAEEADKKQVLMPQQVRPLFLREGSTSSLREPTKEEMEDLLAQVHARGEEGLGHLRAWIEQSQQSPVPSYFPELEVGYIRL